jgi:RES domain
VRVTRSKYSSTPLGFAPGISRFGGSEKNFAVLYAASDLATALAETVVRDRFEGLEVRRLFVSELLEWTAVQISAVRPLRVVDLRKGGCLKLGVSTDIAGAKCFKEAQRFSDSVYQVETTDGILYASRLTGENCVAVFDRAVSHLYSSELAPLVQLDQVGFALETLNIELIG